MYPGIETITINPWPAKNLMHSGIQMVKITKHLWVKTIWLHINPLLSNNFNLGNFWTNKINPFASDGSIIPVIY